MFHHYFLDFHVDLMTVKTYHYIRTFEIRIVKHPKGKKCKDLLVELCHHFLKAHSLATTLDKTEIKRCSSLIPYIALQRDYFISSTSSSIVKSIFFAVVDFNSNCGSTLEFFCV